MASRGWCRRRLHWTIAVALPSSLLVAGLVVPLLRDAGGGRAAPAPSARLFRAIRMVIWAIVAAIVVCRR